MKKYNLILFSDIYRPLHGKGMGVYRLANHIRNQGYTVKVIHGFVKITDDDFFNLCKTYISAETLLIGLGATVLADLEKNKFFGIESSVAENRFRKIKELYPHVKLCLGGAQVTGANDSYLSNFDYFDYAVKGQGEIALTELLNHIKNNTKLNYSTITKPKIITDKSYPFDNFNESFNSFTEDDAIQQKEGLPIEIARGCIFKCKFCGYDLIGKKMGDYTKQSQLIKKELLENYKKWGTIDYYIADETINDSPEKIDMLLDAFSGLPFKPSFGGFLRLDLIWKFPEMAKKLLDMGLESCSFGIETVNDSSGKVIGKGLGKNRIEETLSFLRTAWGDKVFVNASFILGLKYDNHETALELDNWLEEQFSKQNLHMVFVKPLYIMPNTGISYLDKNYSEQGYRKITEKNFQISTDRTRSVVQEDCLIWETDQYNFIQATYDADQIHKKYNDKKLCKGKIAKHNMAFIKSLLPEEYKTQLVLSLIHDRPFDGLTWHETESLIYDLDKKHYENYLSMLLGNK